MGDSGKTIPLNCLDRCELALEGLTATMVIHAILDLQGEIEPERLNQAIQTAQRWHPVTRTVIRSRYLGTYREIQDDLGDGVLTVQDLSGHGGMSYDDCLFEWMNRPLDVKKGFPLRALLVRKNEVESSLVFTFHHSATDGLRALIFIRKAIEAYNGEVPDDAEPPEDIRLSRRGDELLELAQSQRPKVDRYYRRIAWSLFRRVILDALPPPARVFRDRSGRSKEVHLCNLALSPAELERIESKTLALGAELNDVYLAACCRAIERWNSMHGRASNRIRLMVPVNTSPRGFRHVLSNQLSWISPSTTPADRADPAALVKKIRSYSIRATRERTAFSLTYLFYFGSRVPLPVMRLIGRFFMLSRIYVDSALTTNVGVVWPRAGSEKPAVTRIGEARIVNVTGSGPVGNPMGLTVGASIYDRSLNISLAYRTAFFSREKARQLLGLLVRELVDYPVAAGPA
jgi:NRPS condensation-like uncharacterized protein